MEFNQFKEKAFEAALKNGCDAAELYFVEGDSFSAMVLEQELDSYSVSRERGLNLRVQLAGKNGYAYTESLDAPEALVLRAMDNARAIENEDDHPMQGKCEYRALPKRECRVDAASEREKIELAMALERAVKDQDARVLRVMRCAVGSGSSLTRICNTLGLDAEGEERIAYSYAVPVASAGGQVKDGFAFRVDDGIFDVDGCAKEAVARAVAQLGGAPVPAGEYRILFENLAMGDMLAAFSPMFSADAAQKGLSLLAGKEGEMVAAPCVTILDDPFAEEEYAIAYKKGNDELGEKLDSALTQLKEDGTLDEIVDHWIGDDADQKSYTPDDSVERSGTLVMATNAEFPPYESMDGDKVVGVDVDMMQAVCDILGMELKVENMEFDSIIAAVQSGKADVGVAGMTVTPDREENVSFTQGYATSKQVIIVRKD